MLFVLPRRRVLFFAGGERPFLVFSATGVALSFPCGGSSDGSIASSH